MKTAKNSIEEGGLAKFANQELVKFAKRCVGTFPTPGASDEDSVWEWN